MSETMATVVNIIKEVVGDDIELYGPISRSTSVNSDLALESIDLVVISEKIQAMYGDKIDFAQWLSSMELDEIIKLTIGDLVDYIERCLSST